MKFKTTKKAIKENYNTILSIGYCNAQHLLKYEKEIAYSTRAEGWACDYYDIDNVCISTGYAPTGKKVDYETIRKYDLQAEKIAYNYDFTYEQKKAMIRTLLSQFIQEVTA